MNFMERVLNFILQNQKIVSNKIENRDEISFQKIIGLMNLLK